MNNIPEWDEHKYKTLWSIILGHVSENISVSDFKYWSVVDNIKLIHSGYATITGRRLKSKSFCPLDSVHPRLTVAVCRRPHIIQPALSYTAKTANVVTTPRDCITELIQCIDQEEIWYWWTISDFWTHLNSNKLCKGYIDECNVHLVKISPNITK